MGGRQSWRHEVSQLPGCARAIHIYKSLHVNGAGQEKAEPFRCKERGMGGAIDVQVNGEPYC